MQVQMTDTPAPPAHPLISPVFPRFTPHEAMILNLVASTYPGYITIDELIRKLRQILVPRSDWNGPSRGSIQVAAAMIRAKLGERKWQAVRFISIFEMKPNGRRGRLQGYAWKG
jgi:hypothetical protein